MSSLAPTQQNQRPSGKTPPPAPSAAYAKRAREMQQEESLAGRYRPPALRGMTPAGGRLSVSGESAQQSAGGTTLSAVVDDLAPASATATTASAALPPSSFPTGFRRARAGTLPSNVQLAAQHFATSSPSPLDTQASDFPNNAPGDLAAIAPAPASSLAPSRPGLRHAASVASSIPSANSRLRSGSLNIPAASGLQSNPFGSSIFSSGWLTNNSGFPVLDELRSITSGDSQMDEYDVHTLDYLGLDDAPFRTPPPATVSELRTQAQAAIASSLAQPARMRASTVSNPYRRRGVTLMSTPAVEIEEAAELDEDTQIYQPNILEASDTLSPATALHMGGGTTPYIAKGFKQSMHLGTATGVRPRAISVGNLDDSSRIAAGRRATVTEGPPGLVRKPSYNDLQPPQTAGILSTQQSQVVNGIPTSILRQIVPNVVAQPSPANNRPQPAASVGVNGNIKISTSHLGAPQSMNSARAVSPSRENAQGQIPSRSLWIGNLDPAVTGEDLAHVFAPYGAIESFRLLPEKECGFVNFVDIQDAIRAKDDVLNRLGGNIGMPNGQLVRIGFGKADSAPPMTPITGAAANNNPVSPSVGGSRPASSGISSPSSPAIGPESQLQNSPTRALWIGSIPATTTPATILSVFSPFGPIESARVLTHKNCGFINFERLDDAIRARKALNGRDVLGSDVGAIRIGYARVPVKNTTGPDGQPVATDDGTKVSVPGGRDLTVGATIHALRSVKGATNLPADQQVLGGAVENYRSNLLLSLISSGAHAATIASAGPTPDGKPATVTEQQIILRELANGAPDAEADIAALADFRPPAMYYTTIPQVTERGNTRQWDATKLREFRKRIDSGTCSLEEVDQVAKSYMDGEIVELASDWLGNTVVQKLFEKCSPDARAAMLERLAPHLAMVGIHKNGTWAAQKIIDCATTEQEMLVVAQHLRPYAPPLMLDQFGNYVVQCCLKFQSPINDFIIDTMTDRLWEIAQGRFGARCMRAVLENPLVSLSQQVHDTRKPRGFKVTNKYPQRRVATAIILNSIPLATNPNGALLLTWLLDASGFHSRYRLLAPRFAPHLSHLCTHKLASSTVLRIVNQKSEPEASAQIVNALFFSPNDQVLTDILGDQVNGVAVVQKVLQSPFIDLSHRASYIEVTKRVLTDLKVTNVQAYRRLIEEVGLPVPNLHSPYHHSMPAKKSMPNPSHQAASNYAGDAPSLAAMMAALQMQSVGLPLNQSIQPPPSVQGFQQGLNNLGSPLANSPHPNSISSANFPSSDAYSGFAPPSQIQRAITRRTSGNLAGHAGGIQQSVGAQVANQANMGMMGGVSGTPSQYGQNPNANMHPQAYQQYMYQLYQQQPQQNIGTFHS
ncbi:hypothetical protein FS837_002336 [Tulasnella sp. UAMH 9824]|nr:hypothetical protein FS837_002336 [Tulasnella sp. UAMH 9824]